MTDTHPNMNCSDIDKELKHFLGDLLSDSDYQAYVQHLDSCTKCASRVRSMGSFSNQLWELSEIEVPSDLDSTILFKFEEAKKEPRKSKPMSGKKKLLIGVIVVVLGLVGFLIGKKYFTEDKGEVTKVSDDQEVVQQMKIQKKQPIGDPEAEYLFNQLKGMAASLEPATKTVSKAKPSQQEKPKEKPKEKAIVPAAQQAAPLSVTPSNAYSLHWHIPYFTEADVKQLVGTIKMLNINLEYDDPNFIVFNTSARKIKTLSGGIQFTHKIQLNLPDFVIDGSDPQRDIVASISFTEREPTYAVSGTRSGLSSFEQKSSAAGNSLDWHVLLVSLQQNALTNIVNRNGGTTRFVSKEAVIFSIPGSRIRALATEMQSTGGMFVDLGNSDLDMVTSLAKVNIMIYFSEQ